MKKLIIVLPILISCCSYAQVSGGDFNKKSIHLTTGIEMKYLELGQNPGENVIFLHGFTDTGRSFYKTSLELSKLNSDLKIYVLDQRGHGDSSMPDPEKCAAKPEACFTAKDFAEDVIDFMNQKEIRQTYLVGHSMGSIITQEIALRYPDRIKGIVLIGTFVDGTKNPVLNEFLREGMIEGLWKSALEKRTDFDWPDDAYLLTANDLEPEVSAWIKTDWVADPLASDSLISHIYPETMSIPLGTWIGAIRGSHINVNNSERLENLSVPALILWATQDAVFPLSDQNEVILSLDCAVLKNNISYSYKSYGLKPIPESGMQTDDLGHNLQWAAPKEVAGDINSFIKIGKPVFSLTYADPERKGNLITQKSILNLFVRRAESK